MRIRFGYDLRFTAKSPTTMHLLLHLIPDLYKLIESDELVTDPPLPYELFLDAFGNRCARLVLPPGETKLLCNGIAEVDGLPDAINVDAVQHPVIELPIDTLPYLLSSRYCEIDKLSDVAWEKFGDGPTGYKLVQAICEFVHNHIKFGYKYAHHGKTAYDAFVEGRGVCRDYAHLAVALCRCLGIPARYTTGYLGDIGLPFDPAPMDFSAWFEAYLSNTWYTFDARHNTRRVGRLVMAYGRDAADTALTTSFGSAKLDHFFVIDEEIPAEIGVRDDVVPVVS